MKYLSPDAGEEFLTSLISQDGSFYFLVKSSGANFLELLSLKKFYPSIWVENLGLTPEQAISYGVSYNLDNEMTTFYLVILRSRNEALHFMLTWEDR